MLITVMLANSWFFYPKLHGKIPKFSLFAIFFAEGLMLAFIEFVMTFKSNSSVLSNLDGFDHISLEVYFPLYLSVLLRNCALVLLSVFVGDYMDLKILVLNTEDLLLRNQNKLIVKDHSKDVVLDVNQIYLCNQCRNSTIIYTIDGQIFEKRSSLKEMEELLHELQFVRISKSTLLCLSAVRDCIGRSVRLKACIPSNNRILPIGATYAPEVLPVIQNYLQSEQRVQSSNSQATDMENCDETDNIVCTESVVDCNNNAKVLQVKEFVSFHPGTKLYQIHDSLRIPKSSLARYLKVLQDNGQVIRKGSRKTGGYWVVNTFASQDNEVKKEGVSEENVFD